MERRAEREAQRDGRAYEPVTVVGQHNAEATERGTLRAYIERGSEWLRETGTRVGERVREVAAMFSGASQQQQRDRADRERQEQLRQEQARLAQEQVRQRYEQALAAERQRQEQVRHQQQLERDRQRESQRERGPSRGR